MATIQMTVSGIRVQSAVLYDLLRAPQSGFYKITVAKDDGVPPPNAGAATGNVDLPQSATIVASTAVWNELNNKMVKFPFIARITHTNNVVSDLEFLDVTASSIRKADSDDSREFLEMAERGLSSGELELVVRRSMQRSSHSSHPHADKNGSTHDRKVLAAFLCEVLDQSRSTGTNPMDHLRRIAEAAAVDGSNGFTGDTA